MSVIKNVTDIPNIICNKKQARKTVQRKTILIADTDHYYILDKIELHDIIEYERQIHNDD